MPNKVFMKNNLRALQNAEARKKLEQQAKKSLLWGIMPDRTAAQDKDSQTQEPVVEVQPDEAETGTESEGEK